MPSRSSFAALSLLTGLVACSASPSLSHQELQSDFRASISLASETAAFLRHLDGHTYSSQFIHGHLSFLQQQGSEIATKLSGASVAAQDATSLDALRKSTADLTQTLDNLPSQLARAPAPASSIDHLNSIQEHLEADMPQ